MSQPVSQYGGAAAGAGKVRCHSTRPVWASNARTPPLIARNTRPSPTAGAHGVSASAAHRTRPESSAKATTWPRFIGT